MRIVIGLYEFDSDSKGAIVLRTTDEKIKLRNQWFKMILISLFSLVLMFKIAVTKFTFHFSDLLAFILAIFAIGICSLFYMKVNEALKAFGSIGRSLLPVKREGALELEAREIGQKDEQPTAEDEEELTRHLFAHKEQVKRMKEVQSEIIDRLTGEELHEDDKRDYIDYLLQKEKEIVIIKQEIARISGILEPLKDDQEQMEDQQEIPVEGQTGDTAKAKAIVQLLGKEFVLHASLEQFNHKMREIQHSITVETAQQLKDEGLIDAYFNVTRKGLKEFRRAAKKFSYGDGMKFLSKVVNRGNR
jgi:hypothetical protein